jgi:hypothetical protein
MADENYTHKVWSSRALINADDFVGETGKLFYDEATGTLRISDGITPGGIPVSGSGGGGSYFLPTASTVTKGGVKIDGTTIKIANQVISGFSGNYTDLTNKPSLFSGSYNDLTNKPNIPDGTYANLTGKPTFATVATTGQYTDLLGTPSLSPVATSGQYSDLSGTPSLATVATSGSYNDLTNKPSIPPEYTLPKASALTLGGVEIGNNITVNPVNGAISIETLHYSLTPATDNTIDLGSPTNRFRHLYVAPGSLYVGNIKLTENPNVPGQLFARTYTGTAGDVSETDAGSAFPPVDPAQVTNIINQGPVISNIINALGNSNLSVIANNLYGGNYTSNGGIFGLTLDGGFSNSVNNCLIVDAGGANG